MPRPFALALAALAFASPAFAADPPADAPERLLPPSTQLFVRWDGITAHNDAYKKSIWGGIMAGPTGDNVRALVAKAPKLLGASVLADPLLDGKPPAELKLTLAARVLPRIETTITARSAFGRAAAPVGSAGETPPSFALGVARAGRGYKLAVRVQKRAFQASREVELITKQAKGEVDVRYVGRVSKRAAPWYQQRQRPLLVAAAEQVGNPVAHGRRC